MTDGGPETGEFWFVSRICGQNSYFGGNLEILEARDFFGKSSKPLKKTLIGAQFKRLNYNLLYLKKTQNGQSF